MKVFITGIAGFVGANLARRLVATGVEVHGLVRENSKRWRLAGMSPAPVLHTGSLLDAPDLKAIVETVQPKIVYHLGTYGAYHYQNEPELIFRTSVEGTLTLLEAAKASGVKMVVSTGSSSEYGRKDHPMVEDEVIEPDSYYAIGKAAQTFLGQYYAKEKGLPVITLRLFSVYGSYEEPGRFTPTVIVRSLKNEDIPLASPTTARDFVYVDDVVEVLIAASQRPDLSGEILNVGTGHLYTLSDAVNSILEQTGSKSKALWGAHPSRPFDSSTWVADMTKTHERLGWRAKHTLEAGLKQTINWIRNHSDLYAAS